MKLLYGELMWGGRGGVILQTQTQTQTLTPRRERGRRGARGQFNMHTGLAHRSPIEDSSVTN